MDTLKNQSWLVAFVPLVAVAVVVIAWGLQGTSSTQTLGSQPVQYSPCENHGVPALSELGYAWTHVDITNGGVVDDEMTKRWRDDASSSEGFLSQDRVNYFQEAEAIAFESFVAVNGGRAVDSSHRVILSSQTVRAAQDRGATSLIVGSYPFAGREIAAVAIVEDDANRGGDIVSLCGEEHYRGHLTDALDAHRGLGTAEALAQESERMSGQDEFGSDIEQLAQGWRDTPSGERSTLDPALPEEVKEQLLGIEVFFDLPEAWLVEDASLCFRSDIAWHDCTALTAVDEAGRLASMTVATPVNADFLDVVLNEPEAPYISSRQVLLARIDADLLAEGSQLVISTDQPLPPLGSGDLRGRQVVSIERLLGS